MQTVQYQGMTYEIDEDGSVYVIKTGNNRKFQGRSWRHRITSAPKIRKLTKLANRPQVTDEMLAAFSGPLKAVR